METDFLRIKENFTLGDIVHIISTARRNIFPVIDNFGHLLGASSWTTCARTCSNTKNTGTRSPTT